MDDVRLTGRDLDEAIVLTLGWSPIVPYGRRGDPGSRDGRWWGGPAPSPIPSGRQYDLPPFHASVNETLRWLWPELPSLGWREWHVGAVCGVGYAVIAADDRCLRDEADPREHPAAALARVCLAALQEAMER